MSNVPEPGPQRPARAAEAIRSPDPRATQQDIIEVATHEFARNGLSGARVDEIAAKTACSKRMIYYYFGDKEGLYLRVLEEAYRRVRSVESGLDLDHLEPAQALKALVEFTFDHHHANADFIRQVMAIDAPAKPQVVVCMTEFDVGAIMRAKRAGAKGYILKPFNRPQLLERFREMQIAA